MEDDSSSDCGTGWKALAELQYENRDYPAAYDTGGRAGGRAGGWQLLSVEAAMGGSCDGHAGDPLLSQYLI